jgi:GH24 family phage-related lysozyme (muramidase)
MFLLLAILAGMLSTAAYATNDDPFYVEGDGQVDHVDIPDDQVTIDPNTITIDDLVISQRCIEFIMAYEGCLNRPVADGSQYSIGYGCSTAYAEKYGFSTTYISNEEAYTLLLCVVSGIEQRLNSFMKKYNLSFKQHQYDALISFTFNIGTGWLVSDYRITNLLIRGGYTVNEFACAMVVWCHVGERILNELLNRRIDEIKMFLFNIYEMPKETNPTYTFCPVFFDGTDGSPQTDIGLYLIGQPFGELPGGSHETEDALTGWYTADGQRITPTTIVPDLDRLDVYATWGNTEDVPQDELPPDYYPPEDTSSGDVDVDDPDDIPENTTPKIDATEVFSDVTDKSWYRHELTDLYNAGVINGYEDGTFRGNNYVTTGEALKMILLACGYEEPETVSTHWARGYLNLAIEEGIVVRWQDITDLDIAISRSLVAKIAARALGITAQTDGRPFNDTSDQYVHALYDYNIITGYEDGTFRPKNRLTRAELTAIVWRILELRS